MNPTLDEVVHAQYANGRMVAMLTLMAGILGLGVGLFFAMGSDSDLEVGLAIAALGAVVAVVGAGWWWLRSEPTRTSLYRELTANRARIVWVRKVTLRAGASFFQFFRDDGVAYSIQMTTPGPARFPHEALVACFVREFPQAMHGFSEENQARFREIIAQRKA